MSSDYIFEQKPGKEKVSDVVNEYYTIFGKHDSLNDNGNPVISPHSEEVLAKATVGDKKIYWVKVGSHGRIFNPIGMYSEGKQNKFTSRSGKNEYEFRKVNKRVFDMYVNFLRTKNLAWLNNAERELL